MGRDLLKHTNSIGDGTGADRSHVNDTLNAELERYADAHGVDLKKSEKVGAGFIYGVDPCVWYLPEQREIGAGTRREVLAYLRGGEKPGPLQPPAARAGN